MANMHLVTGFAGYEHVTSADQGLFNSYIFGDLEVVMERGNQFAASIISNNIIRVKDGDLLMQGRFARLNDDSYVDLTIDNGTQGYFRNDLIVARYQKDIVTAVETVDLVVIKGENAESDPVDPAHVKGDIKFGKDFQNDIPLWRVSLDGLNVTGLTCLFSTFSSTLTNLIAHANTHKKGGSDPLSLDDLGIADYTHPAKKVSIPADVAGIIGSDPNVENALGVMGSAFASAVSEASYAWRVIEPSKAVYEISSTPKSEGSAANSITYASEIVTDGENITLVDPTTISLSYTFDFSVLREKFFFLGTNTSGAVARYFHPDDELSYRYDTQTRVFIYRETRTYKTEPVIVDVKVSTDINAYPHNEELDGLYYAFVGKLVDSLVGSGARIEMGSYVGTGTYGETNPCSITFETTPKFVEIYSADGTYNQDASFFWRYGRNTGSVTAAGQSSRCVRLNGATLSWYFNQGSAGYSAADCASYQLNTLNSEYLWFAIL